MNTVVVGGGAAGMMAAVKAADGKNKVTLIEQNAKLGKKLFLTGKGRCNLTNACPVEELFDNIVTNPKFMYSSFYDFDNSATVAFFEELGLRLKTERGERIFPQSDHSSDVIAVLKKKMESLGVDIRLNTRVVKIICNAERVTGVIVKDNAGEKTVKADVVIMATGGRSYPSTGSDGSSFGMLSDLGIKLKECEPSLVPLTCSDRIVTDMQGLSLKNVSISVLSGKKVLYSGFGEMLFTHFGLSGPLILSASSYVSKKNMDAGITVKIDLKPALSSDELDKRILRDFEQFSNKNFANSLVKLLPGKIITAVIKRSGIDPDKKVNVISKAERQRLVDTIKSFDIRITGDRGFDEAIITRGGVDVSQIDPSTMECKSVKGLYFAGEMIDVDALTGGFNLQIAWSTGCKAGICCKEGSA